MYQTQNFRNNCIDYLKSSANKPANFFFTVGDLVLRNTYFFNKINKNSDYFNRDKHHLCIKSIVEYL